MKKITDVDCLAIPCNYFAADISCLKKEIKVLIIEFQ